MAVSRFSQSSAQNAFQKFNNVWDGKSAVGSMDALATITTSAAASASVTFSSIPQTYSHLQLRCQIMGTQTLGVYMQINGDTSTNYSYHWLWADGSATPSSNNSTNQTVCNLFGYTIGANTVAPATLIVDLLDYTDTNKYKTVRSLGGSDKNGTGEIMLMSSVWRKAGSGVTSDAITSLKILTSGGNFAANSVFSLYGTK